MAALAFAEIVKTFGRNSPNAGQVRLSQITRKISEQSEFEMESGPNKLLYFKDDEVKKAYENFDLETVQKFSSKRNPAFVDAEGNPVALSQLTKSSEFGGAGGARGSGPDPHEIMTAALILHYGKRGKKSVPSNAYSNLRNASRVLLALKNTAREIDTTEGDFNEKVEAFDNNFEPYAQAISAADGFLINLDSGSKVTKVYGTGRRWATILKPYKIDDHLLFGKKDYNSSDLIVEVSKSGGAKCFVGISLKKKGTGMSAQDPTVINKTVVGTDGLFKSLVKQGYADVYPKLKNVYKQRSQFFYNVIEASLNSSDRRTRDHARRVLRINGDQVPTYLNSLSRKISTVRSQGAFILAEAQKLGQNNMTSALQGKYPEDRGGVENIYFKAFDEIFMDPKAHKPMVIALLNIIFKTDLQGFLGIRGVPKDEFKFTLLTGKGAFSGGSITVAKADELQETFTTSILTQKMSNPKTSYRVTKTPGKNQAFEGGPAKLFYTIYLSKLPLADIEIRYKGSIRSEPQFFAVITPKFKALYKRVVRMNGGSKKW
jgi:hypothetical protein|tara:strand:- start:66 stop:1697 length:1632 start_codon:yes stop_codon:yes gene_type:complete